jgi:trimeric autotransporter adhesin
MKKLYFFMAICLYAIAARTQNVGVGTSNPLNKLHVAGGLRLDTLTGVNGSGIVTHNANGVIYGLKFSGNVNDVLRGDGTFGSAGSGGSPSNVWMLTGNSGTNPANNFIGTTDNQPVLFRVNNIRHGYLGTSIFLGSNAGSANVTDGNIGIGRGVLQNNNSAYGMQVVIGDSALAIGSSGSANTAVGYRSLYKNATGYENTALGAQTLESNTSGYWNTAIGNNTLWRNTTGSLNVAVGRAALVTNTIGSENVAIGSQAMFDNTTGNSNSAIGNNALQRNTTGFENTAVGYNSLFSNNGYYNSGFGASSLLSNTTGHDNTALGYASLRNNTSASSNTSVGAFSLYNNTTGSENTSIGYKALEQNTTGIWNTAVGLGALQGNTQSSGNAAFGTNALNHNRASLGQNTAFGYNALAANTSGYGNTAIGSQAALNNVSGRYNTAIGFVAAAGLPNNVENTTCIGYDAGWSTTSSNQVNIGNFSVTWIGGQTGWFHYSDKRMKKDIKEDVPGLSFITRLKPVTYHVNLDTQEEIAKVKKNDNDKDWEGKRDIEKIKMTGFLAQDVETAASEINYSFNGIHKPKNSDGLYSLDYSSFVVPLVKAIQEQQQLIEDQNKKIEKQQQQIDLLIKEVQALKKDAVTQKN